jgi:hypothetical protein
LGIFHVAVHPHQVRITSAVNESKLDVPEKDQHRVLFTVASRGMSSEKKSEYVWNMQTGAECEMSVPRNINSAPPASFVTYISRRLPLPLENELCLCAVGNSLRRR